MRIAVVLASAVFTLTACNDSGLVTHQQGTTLPIDHPDLAQRLNARDSRRLSHLQLRRSVDAALGTKWTEDGVDLLYALGPTLGDPDYEEITEENLDPSPLYVKFMEDLSNAVCAEVPMEVLEPEATPEANVASLKLRLHGEWYAPGDPLLAPLVELEREAGMRAVCVALLAAPEFYLY